MLVTCNRFHDTCGVSFENFLGYLLAAMVALVTGLVAERLGKRFAGISLIALSVAALVIVAGQAILETRSKQHLLDSSRPTSTRTSSPGTGGALPIPTGAHPSALPSKPPPSSKLPSPSTSARTSTSTSTRTSTTSSTRASATPTRVQGVTGQIRRPPTPSLNSWVVDARTSDAGEASSTGPNVDLRFWHYPGNYGDVVFHGSYATTPETVTGNNCGNAYVHYFLGGVPAGTYSVSALIPDISNLSAAVDYGSLTVNQAMNRGLWVDLGTQRAIGTQAGGYTLQTEVTEHYVASTIDGCKQTGKHVAFGPVKFTLVDS